METKAASPIDAMAPLPLAERLALAQKAFDEFQIQCFWFLRDDLKVTEANLETIAKGLRTHGGHRGYKLAARICP